MSKGKMLVNVRKVGNFCCSGCYHPEYGKNTNSKSKKSFRRSSRSRENQVFRNEMKFSA